jgi:hypothetical protein
MATAAHRQFRTGSPRSISDRKERLERLVPKVGSNWLAFLNPSLMVR